MKKLILVFFIISSLVWGLYAQEAPPEEPAAESEDTWLAREEAQPEASGSEKAKPEATQSVETDLERIAYESAETAQAESEFVQAEPDQAGKSGPAKFGGLVLDYFNKPATSRHNEPLRVVEFGFDLGLGFANNLLGKDDIFQKELVIDLNEWVDTMNKRGVDFGFDFVFNSFININVKKGAWGIGEFINVDSYFDMNLPKSLFELLANGNYDVHNPEGEFAVSGAVFAEAGLKWYGTFLDKKLKVGFAPAWYLPLVYAPKSTLKYVLQTDPGLQVAVSGDMVVYMPISMDPFEIKDFGGMDLSFSGEYALFPIIDVGATISHVPFVPATLTNGQTITFSDDIIPYTDNLLSGDFPKMEMPELDPQSFTGASQTVLRPMRIDFYVLYRPLRIDLLTIKPNIGFTTINPSEKTYFNGAIEAQLNLGRIFFVHLNTGVEEGYWRHKLGFALNLRVLEVDLEGVLKSQSYVKSYQASGLEATLGLKLGF
jgi:hypothetical protein